MTIRLRDEFTDKIITILNVTKLLEYGNSIRVYSNKNGKEYMTSYACATVISVEQ